MKTVSGVVISSKPVSLSKAAKILSKFSAADNGATPAYAHYLKRTSESFDELVQLHKELRGPNSERRSKSNRSGTTRDEAEGPVSSVQNRVLDDEFEEKYVEIPMEMKEPKKKKRKNTVDNSDERRTDENLNNVENGVGDRKREKEAKKVKKHLSEDGGSNGVLNAVQIENDVKKVEHRIYGKLDKVEDDMGGKKREKETEKVKKHVSEDVLNVAKNVVDNGVENGMGGKKREKEGKKARNNVIEDGGSNGDLNVVGIVNDVSKKRKMKDGSVDENRVEKKVSKKRKSEEIAEAVNGDVNDSPEKLMKHKKRKKSKVMWGVY